MTLQRIKNFSSKQQVIKLLENVLFSFFLKVHWLHVMKKL